MTAFPASPCVVRHAAPSMLFSMDDDCGRADDWLLDLALLSIREARQAPLSSVTARMHRPPFWPEIWPGEHYKLLWGIVAALGPTRIVEVGTYTGLSALAMLASLTPAARLTTYDVLPWDAIPETCLCPADFADGRLVQHISDLSDPAAFASHSSTIQNADLIFVDGPKDGAFEERFLHHLGGLRFERAPLVVLDDIRLWNMLAPWRGISAPKLDLTSFGHWSGTGLVHWTSS